MAQAKKTRKKAARKSTRKSPAQRRKERAAKTPINPTVKPPAKPVDAEQGTNGDVPPRSMAGTLRKYRPTYEKTTLKSGQHSMDKGDDLAVRLRAVPVDSLFAICDHIKGVEPGTHAARYDRLNPGQRRMNCGNIIRAAIKAEKFTIDQISGQ